MKSTLNHILGCTTLILFAGCAGPASVGPSGASAGLLFSNVTYPSANFSLTEYHLTTADFEILGNVRGEGKSFNLLGLFSSGNSGYEEALEQARAAGADEIINLRVDTTHIRVLGLFLQIKTIVTGTAVKWKRENDKPVAVQR